MPLEIACFNASSAITAAKAGADRIELCADYAAGGVTPALSTLQRIRQDLAASCEQAATNASSTASQARLPIMVMIRPRGGNFSYSAAEFDQMKSSMHTFKSSNAVDGFVFGVLTPNNRIDEPRNRELVEAAAPLPCTFHRAIDKVHNLDAAVEMIVDCGFVSVLTSGGAESASEGTSRVAGLQVRFGERISVVLGGGVRSANAIELRNETGVEWLHSAAITGLGEEVDQGEVGKMVACLQDTG